MGSYVTEYIAGYKKLYYYYKLKNFLRPVRNTSQNTEKIHVTKCSVLITIATKYMTY